MTTNTAIVASIIISGATSAAAQTAGPFANHSFEITFTELQRTDDPARPEIPQNRRTRIDVATESAATVVTRNFDKPPPGFEQLAAAGALGSWASLENRAIVRHEVVGSRLTQTIFTRGFLSRLIIDLDGRECRAKIDYAPRDGETGFHMRNIALGTPMLVTSIGVAGEPTCATSYYRGW